MLSGGSPWPVVAQTNITRGSLIRFTSTERHTCKTSGCNDQASSPQPGLLSFTQGGRRPACPPFHRLHPPTLPPPPFAQLSRCFQAFPSRTSAVTEGSTLRQNSALWGTGLWRPAPQACSAPRRSPGEPSPQGRNPGPAPGTQDAGAGPRGPASPTHPGPCRSGCQRAPKAAGSASRRALGTTARSCGASQQLP